MVEEQWFAFHAVLELQNSLGWNGAVERLVKSPAAGCPVAFWMFARVETTPAPSSDAGRGAHPHGKKILHSADISIASCPIAVCLWENSGFVSLRYLEKLFLQLSLPFLVQSPAEILHFQLRVCLDNISICSLSIDFVLHLRSSLSAMLALSHPCLTFKIGIDYFFFWGGCGLEIKQLFLSPFSFQGSFSGILTSKCQNDLKSALLGSKQWFCCVFLTPLRNLKSWMFTLSYSLWLRFPFTFISLTTSWYFLSDRLSRISSLLGLSIS